MKLSDHFSLDEFKQPARHGFKEVTYPVGLIDIRLVYLVDTLELIRSELRRNHPRAIIKVTSGYRTRPYNEAIGGSSNSQHIHGRAADITVPGVEADVVHQTIVRMWKGNVLPWLGGLGKYRGFVHVDCRRNLARWSG